MWRQPKGNHAVLVRHPVHEAPPPSPSPVARMDGRGRLRRHDLRRPSDLSAGAGLAVSDTVLGTPGWARPATALATTTRRCRPMAAVNEAALGLGIAVYIAPARPLLEVGRAVAHRRRALRGTGVARGGDRLDARRLRAARPAVLQPRQALRRDDPGAAGTVAGRLGGHGAGTDYQVPRDVDRDQHHARNRLPHRSAGSPRPQLRRRPRLCDGWLGTADTWDQAGAYGAGLTATAADIAAVQSLRDHAGDSRRHRR